MSIQAEYFTRAAMWQFKHQIAYWKAKATALEYENKLLHDIIKEKLFNVSGSSDKFSNETDSEGDSEISDEADRECEDENDLEVSEEFMQFLISNQKFKEEARRERELLKAKNASTENIAQPGSSQCAEDSIINLKNMYGSNWERISALETYAHSLFISKCDEHKPVYWPNVPLNFQ